MAVDGVVGDERDDEEGGENVSGVNLMMLLTDMLLAVKIASSEPRTKSTAPWASTHEFPKYRNEQGKICSPSQSEYTGFWRQKLSRERLSWRF